MLFSNLNLKNEDLFDSLCCFDFIRCLCKWVEKIYIQNGNFIQCFCLEPLSEFAEENDDSGENLTSPRTWVIPTTVKTPLISRRENPGAGVVIYNVNSYKKTTACLNGKCEITICVNGECTTTTNWNLKNKIWLCILFCIGIFLYTQRNRKSWPLNLILSFW